MPRPSVRPFAVRLPLPPGTVATGMVFGVLAYFLFALHDACIKWLVGGGMPAWQILCVRSAMICTVCLAFGRRRMLERVVATPVKRRLLARSVITLLAWLCYYSASGDLPLAQLLTLYFAAPIVTTLLAAPLLHERVPPVRWLSVGVGFAGVVVACDPGGVAWNWATVRVLVAAVFWGYAVILMRQTALRESNLVLMCYANTVSLVAGLVACATLGWHMPDRHALVLLLAIGGIGALAQLALYEGMRHAAASVMATVEYSALIWAFVLGLVIWGDVPRLAVFLGAGLILGAGALLVAGERRAG